MDYEVVVKYNGNILRIRDELEVSIELLGYNYAIIIADTEEKINRLLEYEEIEYVEKPFILETQDTQSFSATGITRFKQRYNLTGKGTILGVIDSGIDYTLSQFRDKDGNSKILYYWDQSIGSNPPQGFNEGTLYTNEDINKAIKGEINIPISTTSSHGTHVAGICSQIAQEARMIVVRVGRRQTDSFSKSTEFMRAIKFVLDKALELKMPISINISYGSNEGSHKGLSLFEQYIDEMAGFWKNNICVASGNNADKGGHKNINIKGSEKFEVEFIVGPNEKLLNINIWPDYIDNFYVYLISPSNKQTQSISLTSGEVKNVIDQTRIKGYFYPIPPYSLIRRITIQMSSVEYINQGIWKIVFIPIDVISGNVNIYLPTSEGLSKETRFVSPTKRATVTVPGTASKVITVGSFNSRTDNVSIFSGEGDIENGIYKPDLLAPGEDIVSVLPGGNTGALTGTSMATPHVTGSVALLMEWGIVNKNDLYLYSQKMKALLTKHARRTTGNTYPNNSMGYGFLDLSQISLTTIQSINQEEYYRSTKKTKKKRKITKNKNIKKYKRTPEEDIGKQTNDENKITIPFDLKDVFKHGILGGINILHKPEFEDEFKKLNTGYYLYKINESLCVVFIIGSNLDNIEHIMALKSVISVEPFTKIALLSKVEQGTTQAVSVLEDIDATFFKNNPNIVVNGRGVAIAIIDSGIDYLHDAFIYPDGTSKILYLWDQTKEGNPPKGYYIGTEYTRDQINEAIKNKDATLSTDEEGSGTMLSGICSGLKTVNGDYEGIAEESELIVVKLNKIGKYYNNATYFAAGMYVYEKAQELGMSLVINGSLGSNDLVAITQRVLSKTTFFTQGICEVRGAGDEGNTQTHTSGRINFNGEEKIVELELSEDEERIDIQLWVTRPDKINVGILSPSGEVSKMQPVSNYSIITGKFDFESTQYIINYIYPTTYSGQQQANITLINVKKGIWKIKLVGEYITNGMYQMYLPNRVFIKNGTKFRDVDPNYTINYPATLEDIITVGAYDTINNSLWPTSSRGPNINGMSKPDVVAPGVKIIAPYPGNKYGNITGTAAAAAQVTGAVALFMQYILEEDNYPDKAFVQKINTFVKAGAVKNKNINYPNENYGYGLLNIKNMFEQLK
ncbi:bifunctional germination protease/germinant receptor pseudoprotease CspBA [Romboutsia lituseburensis]|uniref:bifunctional germination protease/germinant receptor pseudoprotease CspBA n=1 Tax=Romboutsia lituseburensis TaxID=1537 RepID=UPI00215A6693|nr:bifunctional germination protease/germinant receptor pseudoprotease CspBA [Romboutsia lituseburensis]MCR8746957.1 bifunctional germination protease/germinant receptor pseudoprotease CspBA [Romboutsia lituseburensis]